MSKGQTLHLVYDEYADPQTGMTVTRLTPPDVTCHRNYFYQKCFSNDGTRLLFGGGFDGHWNYYLLDLPTGVATQLTEGPGDNTFGGFLSPDDRHLYYVKNDRRMMRLDLDTLDESIVYEVPDDYVGYGTWVANSTCDKVVGIEIAASDYEPLTDWHKFKEFYYRRPRCRLLSIDLRDGARTVVHEANQWLGHPIYRPFDDNTVAFCHEGPHDVVETRMWLVDEDGSNLRKVHEHADGESCTHEFWVPDGSRMIYVSYRRGDPRRYIRGFNPKDGTDTELMQMPPCSHLMSNFDGSLLVGDGCGTPVDVNDVGAHEIDNDPYLYLFEPTTGTTKRIAAHHTSWAVLDGNRQVTHPHPSFTPDSRRVLFTSDRDGKPVLYLADVPR
ncbi:oligogalacturonate lyase family protein [Burkholderia pyrrocinia]|uniref:Oligogalacturonate lyase family protein n=1 Tax=Burkholderia pyrrocinia TaxID=60550 RepID=A0ABZ3BRP9_BURPY